MVRMRYVGVTDPKAAFEALRPAHAAVEQMMRRCRPFHPDYLILSAVMKAMQTAAHHFTGDPFYFGGGGGQP